MASVRITPEDGSQLRSFHNYAREASLLRTPNLGVNIWEV